MHRFCFPVFSLLLLGSLWLFAGCGEDDDLLTPCTDPANPDCSNYDPCWGVSTPSSAFMMFDSTTAGVLWVDTSLSVLVDTLYATSGAGLYFRPLQIESGVTYEWQIGDDPRLFEAPIITQSFNRAYGNIEVRLVAKIEDSLACLNPELRSDTSYQTLTLLDGEFAASKVWGTYRGNSSENPDEEVVLDVFLETEQNVFAGVRASVLQLCCNGQRDYVRITACYDWFVSTHPPSSPRCRELTVTGKLREDNHNLIDIDYWYKDDEGVRRHYTFTGRRQ
jgi:hypothetical protein